MRRVLLGLIFFTNLALGNNGCGSVSLNFEEAHEKFRPNIFQGFVCPLEAGDESINDNIVLTSIDFTTGAYSCQYGLDNQASAEEIYDKDSTNEAKTAPQNRGLVKTYTNRGCRTDYDTILTPNVIRNLKEITPSKIQSQIKINKTDGGSTTQNIGRKVIGDFIVYQESNKYMKGAQLSEFKISFIDLYKKLNTIKNKESSIEAKELSIKTNKEGSMPTISELFSATVTLDSNYFSKTEAVDENGKINLNAPITLDTSKTGFWIFGSEETKPINPVDDIMDSQVWGFYVSFIENIRIAEQAVVLMLFFAGFIGVVTQKLGQAGINYWGDNDSKTDIGWKKMLVSPVTMLILFVAPIVPSGLTIDSRYIHKSDNTQVGINLSGGEGSSSTAGATSETAIGRTTLVQTAIQYFTHWGVLAANTFSDYALHPYLRYLQISQGAVMSGMAKMSEENLLKNQEDFIVLQKEVDFYNTFCRFTYGESGAGKDYINKTAYNKNIYISNPLSGRDPYSLAGLTQRAVAEGNKNNSSPAIKEIRNTLNVSAVSSELCSKLEKDINTHSHKAITNFIMLSSTIDTVHKRVADDENSDVANIKNLVTQMAKSQESVGWIYSAIVPLSFTLYKANAVGETVDERKENSEGFVSNSISRENQLLQETNVEKSQYDEMGVKSYEEEGFLAEAIVSQSAYFIFPGFNNLFTFLKDVANSIFEKIRLIITVYLTFTASPAAAIVFNFVYTLLAGAVAAILSFWIATKLYDFMLEVLSLTSICIMIIFRIIFYFVEVLIFFVASPAVVIWAVVSSRPETIWKYIGKGAVLAITPILIVISCYLFIFATELLNSLFGFILGVVFATFITENSTFTQTLSIISMTTILSCLTKLVYVFAGYIIIIKFNGWFLRTVGAETGFMEQVSEDMGRKTQGLISPIKA